MIILHAGYYDNHFLVWGESPLESSIRPTKHRGKKPQNLVYDSGHDKLRSALKDIGIISNRQRLASEEFIAWIPTVNGYAVPSSPLIGEIPSSQSESNLLPWIITAAELDIASVIDLLCKCVDRQLISPGIIIGNDLAYWSAVLRFAGAIITRQQYLPGMAIIDGFYHSKWQPVFVGKDTERLHILGAAMPGICRAVSSDAVIEPQTNPITLLQDFLSIIVDHVVRSSQLSDIIESRNQPAFNSLHDEWIHSLCSLDSTINWNQRDTIKFLSAIRDWQRPVSVISKSPFRFCFRLEEPVNDSENWEIRYLLQAMDDPSLIVDAKDAWKAKGKKASVFKERGFNPTEYMLSALGQASGICPQIENSLKSSNPDGYSLKTSSAYDFLSNTSLLLEDAGFGVMLPAWWSRKGTKLQLSTRAKVKSSKMAGSGISLGSLVDVEWEIALGDEEISIEELMDLARLKSPLVKLRGQWVQMDAGDIQAAIDFWKKRKSALSVKDTVMMALGKTDNSYGMDVEIVSSTGWISDFLATLNDSNTINESRIPQRLHGELRPYQKRGLSWLQFLRQWGLGACLADDMGLGKTIQTLSLIQGDWESGVKKPVLLICPTSVVGNWQKEADKFTPDMPVMVHHGTGRKKDKTFVKEAQKSAIVISSYSLLYRDLEMFNNIEWSGIVLDEAQNIKNPETRQSKAARLIEGDYRIALTGTPVENNVSDLWSIMEFLNPGFLGNQTQFKKDFFIPIQMNQDEEATDRLKKITGPFILRRLKTDRNIINDLPEKMEMNVFCNLTKEQASLYAAVVQDFDNDIESTDGIERKGTILAALSKLKQICNHPVQFLGDNSMIPGRSGKLARLTEMLEEIMETEDKVLIFTQFAEMGNILQKHLQETLGKEAIFLHGGVSKKNRDNMVERFQSDTDAPPIFILSLKAGGTGLNLTKANHVFHFDRWWNPAVENQATDRAFRIGQTKNVQVHKFVCAGTIEERIDEMIERKKEIANSIVGTGEGWLTELSTSEIRSIFALRKDAVGD